MPESVLTPLMTPAQVADALGETRQKVRARIESGELPAFSVEGQDRNTFLIDPKLVDELRKKLAGEALERARKLGAVS